ncbi:uncharacterized protein B0H18DRAFT_327188 [Fomitopsis serialis]|uniref:uncharacterized protein n=1 Tax=Fomitopsis serialis TaxID=139415 RepID=UPI002007E9CC|nr:uncharacterized protein B0H18DRAFT_327188 [Neoantrodia serialis]KAH9936595.1 hypothetical protein B0H18DRAFT_327188 [Neoantrodia serialis]
MTSVSSPPSRRPNTRRKQCLCGNWFSVKPERDRYCSKACALVDSWNTLVAGESHYRREMAARETMRAVSAKRVASSRTLRTPEVTAAITVGQYSGPADQASHYGAFDKAGSHRARPAAGDALPKPRNCVACSRRCTSSRLRDASPASLWTRSRRHPHTASGRTSGEFDPRGSLSCHQGRRWQASCASKCLSHGSTSLPCTFHDQGKDIASSLTRLEFAEIPNYKMPIPNHHPCTIPFVRSRCITYRCIPMTCFVLLGCCITVD